MNFIMELIWQIKMLHASKLFKDYTRIIFKDKTWVIFYISIHPRKISIEKFKSEEKV